MQRYTCKHCQGTIEIAILEETEKATEPIVEFCPFCGASYCHPRGNEISENF